MNKDRQEWTSSGQPVSTLWGGRDCALYLLQISPYWLFCLNFFFSKVLSGQSYISALTVLSNILLLFESDFASP